MGDTKLEISGKTTEDPPPATFKTISESDTEETALRESEAKKSEVKKSDSKKNMSKTNSMELDGADEKMLNEEKPLTEDSSKIDTAEAKFSLNADKQNGEAKLDIGDTKPAFVGMGKDELMKYANDPFWVRLRWVLFVSFWLVWLGMLAGAIYIIIDAPKCAPPEPRTWWEQGPLAEVDVDVELEILDKLKQNKIRAVIVSNNDINQDSYISVDESTSLLKFLKVAKEKDINVIINLNPTYANSFFSKSESLIANYSDYYIWVDVKHGEDGARVLPNNWLTKHDKSAWSYSEKRQQFYYNPEHIPMLNFRNPDVVGEFSKVLQNWIDQGVKGVQLSGVPHLLVDENMRNWSMASGPNHYGGHTEYDFYDHKMTENVEGIADILKEWRKIVKDGTANGPFMLKEDLKALDVYTLNTTLTIDMPRHSNVFIQNGGVSTASRIYQGVNSAFIILEDNWPLWKYMSTSLSTDVMNIITMLLPGSVLVDPSEDINPSLLSIRDVPSVMYGSCHRELLANETVFAYQRVQAGNPGYLVACNPSDDTVTVDFSSMKNVSTDVTVQVLSNNYSVPNIETGLKVSAKAFEMPPKSAAVLTYVPK